MCLDKILKHAAAMAGTEGDLSASPDDPALLAFDEEFQELFPDDPFEAEEEAAGMMGW